MREMAWRMSDDWVETRARGRRTKRRYGEGTKRVFEIEASASQTGYSYRQSEEASRQLGGRTVLADISDHSVLIKVASSTLGSKLLRHDDRDRLDDLLVEDGLDKRIGEPKVHNLSDHLLTPVQRRR
jgi:hypothetical protein